MAEYGNPLSEIENSNLSSTSQEKQSPSPTGVPHNIRPNTLSTNQDAYWFAHAADPPIDRNPSRHNPTLSSERDENLESLARRLEDELSPNDTENDNRALPRNRAVESPCQSECKEDSSPLSQKEREDRFRQFKERQEDERQRRLQDLQQQSILAQRFREQQEDERRRKIDELRQKDLERRMAVEERKRQIWEADQERKEAILRRNLEREAKIEARRNAHRNSMSFAFGSSTPRIIDLDLGGFANKSPTSPYAPGGIVSPPLNGRRTPSGGGLDQRSDEVDGFEQLSFLSRDLDEGSPSRANQLNRRSRGGMSSEATKACLTFPENSHPSKTDRPRSNTTSNPSSGWLIGTRLIITGAEDSMSRSMVILPSASRGRRKTDLTPTLPWERDVSMRSHSPASSTGLTTAKRAVSMSRLDILAQPRRRYVVDHSPSSSNIASSNSQGIGGSTSGNTSLSATGGPRTTSSKMRKDSPSRPRSSMSGTSEMSTTSTVSMRSQSGPRKPRPVSMVGAIPDASQRVPTPPQRQSRTSERKTAPVGVTPPRPPRAKSAGTDALPPPKPPPRKSAQVPKPVSPKSAAPAVPIAGAASATIQQSENKPEKPIASVQPNTLEPAIPSVSAPVSAELASASVPIAEQVVREPSVAKDEVEASQPLIKNRITSEEEAKAALAEKRKMAREQAEREAELERLRIEELRRQEEEQRRLEEEEQRRMEEEQLRLAQELRKQDEEKLQKAILEQQEREVEELKRQEEEAKLKVERDEQEKKAKEEAEKQRKEMEEKLKKEEIDRAERKKRVEQIMKRTRGKASASQDGETLPAMEQSVVSAPSPLVSVTRPTVPPPAIPVNGQTKEIDSDDISVQENTAPSTDNNIELLFSSESKPLSVLVEVSQSEPKILNGFEEQPNVETIIAKTIVDSEVNKAAEVIHTNGFSSPDESVTEGNSPEEKTDPMVGSLLDFDSIPTTEGLLRGSSPSIEFDQLIDLSTATTTTNVASNQNEVNLLNAAEDDVNSNRMVPNNPFIAFEDNVTKKQESSFTDLLS